MEVMEEKRTIRVYHKDPQRQLARHEAIRYLSTRELPERVVLSGYEPEQIERYQVAPEHAQQSMRTSYGHITVAVGRTYRDAPLAEGPRLAPREYWEAIPGLEITITPFDPEANVVTGGGDILISVGSKPRTIDETQGLLRALAVATGIAGDAGLQVLMGNVITN